MDFGAGDGNKFNYGRTLAAVLSYLMVRQHDAPGLIVFGAQSRQATPASSTRHHADEIFHTLNDLKPVGVTNVDQTLVHMAQTLTRRGLAVVISDFLGGGEACFELLRQLRRLGPRAAISVATSVMSSLLW